MEWRRKEKKDEEVKKILYQLIDMEDRAVIIIIIKSFQLSFNVVILLSQVQTWLFQYEKDQVNL